jgi:hypothetical protein
MKIKIQVIIESDDGHIQDIEEVACLKRGMLTPEELGLNLAEAKQILHNVQTSMLGSQVAEYQAQRKNCPHCRKPPPQKGRHGIVFRTLFGKFTLPSWRLYRCECQPERGRTFSPLAELLPERTAPELLYLEAKWCTLLSFGVSVNLLQEVLPLGEELNTVTVRNNLHKVAERIEAELGEERVSFLDAGQELQTKDPIPAAKPPLTQVEKDLESIKWHLWNGNVDQALELIGGLRVLLADDHIRAERQKLPGKALSRCGRRRIHISVEAT